MLLRDEVFEAEPPSGDRVRLSHDADHAVGQKLLGADRTGMIQTHADRDVDFIALQAVDGRRRRQMQHVETELSRPWRSRDQGRQDQAGQDIGHPNGERSRRRLGIETGIAFEYAFDLPQQLPERFNQFGGAGSSLHSGGGADQQFVSEHPAQAVEGIAHRRLTEADPFGRPCDMPLGEQGVQRHQQVQVHRPQIQRALPSSPPFLGLLFTILIFIE